MGILEAGACREVHEGWVEFVQAEMLGERCFLVEKPETRDVDMGHLYGHLFNFACAGSSLLHMCFL